MPPRYPQFSTPFISNAPNLQLFFWRRCIQEWKLLCDIYATGREGWQGHRFAEQAALVLVLAGTGLSQLYGLNDPVRREGDPDWVDPLGRILKRRFKARQTEVPQTLQDFVDAYDDVRHFGTPRFASDSKLGSRLLAGDAPQWLLGLLRAAHLAWKDVVERQDFEILDDVTSFVFDLPEAHTYGD